MSELFGKRIKFTRYLMMLLKKMIDDGWEPMIGRDGEKHMDGSLHNDGLAKDIILTKAGVVFDKTEDHRIYGEYWESLDPDCYWGGPGLKVDGLTKDGNHYSVTFQGRK